ncbi:MAG TPA: hypothetical protein VM513_05760 [Kofleriaceae bacterium]|nr:hypothetical protein [Kofleriaceae bacterium]
MRNAGLAGLMALGLFVGCGGDDGGTALGDPRCVAVCTDEPPSVAGAFDVCDPASTTGCFDECEARIADVATVCASCLLERASFGPGVLVINEQCSGTTCTVTGRVGSCSFAQDDPAAKNDCYRQVYPRREIACEPDFRDPAECASLCS